LQRDAASFRDPAGNVYREGPRVLRVVTARGAPDYERLRDSGALRAWIERRWVIRTTEVRGRSGSQLESVWASSRRVRLQQESSSAH